MVYWLVGVFLLFVCFCLVLFFTVVVSLFSGASAGST